LKRLRLVSKVSKIVVLTGYGALKTAKEAMRLGAYDYTAKPFDLHLIRELIAEAVETGGRKREAGGERSGGDP
jgi:DNA-binding NtrC family response regulator